MNLSGIISIGGMSGLFKIVAQIKNGVLVESLIDKKRVPAYSTHKVSELENITIYSTGGNVPLKDVFQKIYDAQKGGAAIDHKLPDAELKKYFKLVLPDYDEERVYVSDIKKVINWYNLLQKEGLLEVKESAEEKTEDKPKAKTAVEKEKKAPKKTSTKTTATKSVKTAGTKVKVAGVRKTGVA
jgi:hypothetical protein